MAAQFLHRAAPRKRGNVEVDSIDTVHALVSAGRGISVVPKRKHAIDKVMPVREIALDEGWQPRREIAFVCRQLDADNRRVLALQQASNRPTCNPIPDDRRTCRSPLTVTYNDGTDQTAVQYTATTRVAKKGATHLGWSNSNDYGATWSYGGRVATSDAWPILWGDPGITNSVRDQHYVYIVSLAIPKAKLDGAPGGEISGAVNDYIGGACIARSTNGGKTFSLYQCVQTTEADSTGDFYDGGNMASDTQGKIYAGWINVDRGAVHIWRAVGESGTFQKLANPFGGSTMTSHPRLRVNLETNELFVMAIDINGELLLARWNGSSWGATWHTGMFAQSYPCIVASGALCGRARSSAPARSSRSTSAPSARRTTTSA